MALYEYKATCVNVVDGDTVDLIVELGFSVSVKERFRLLGINAPETYGVKKESEEYQAGMLAKNRLIELILDKPVMIVTEKDKKGKYGRYLAEIYVDGNNVNTMLLEEGLVSIY